MKINYTIHTRDFFGAVKEFHICWKVDILNKTFVIGVDLSNPHEVSLFQVDYEKRFFAYSYNLLHTYFWDVFQKNHFSIEERIQKDIKNYFIKKPIRCQENILKKNQAETPDFFSWRVLDQNAPKIPLYHSLR